MLRYQRRGRLVISLPALARLAAEHADDLERPVAAYRVGERAFDTDTTARH